MLARIKRTATSFVAVLAAFWVYRLVAVPLIEPKQTPKRVATIPPEERAKIAEQQQNRLGGYARFFPPGSWELDHPMVIDNDTSKLVVQAETPPKPSRQLDIQHCTFIGFPDGEAEEADSHRRVIIMQVPEGGVLEFEDEVDFTGGKLSQLKGAVLRGPITIRSAATQPDGSDDLYVTTHDAKLIDNVISTPNEVDYRFGQNSGHGRNMRIELLPAVNSPGDKRLGPNFSGIQTLELTYDVTMHLQPKSSGFIPGDQQGPAAASQSVAAPPNSGGSKKNQPPPPVDIRCDGPFQFDLVSNIATFHDGVIVMRPSPTGVGPDDQLRNCDLLTVFFQPREAKPTAASDGNSPTRAVNAGKAGRASGSQNSPKTGMQSLEARRFEAKGNPVIVDAPSNMLQTRSQRLEYDIFTGRIVLDMLQGNDDVFLKQRTNEVHARSLMYEPGPNGTWLGLADSKGPGWLNVAMGSDTSQRFEARWKDELKMTPDAENRRISLLGNAWARYAGRAEISADALHLWLHETPLTPQDSANSRGGSILFGGRGGNPTSSANSGNRNANRPAARIQPVKLLAEMQSIPLAGGVPPPTPGGNQPAEADAGRVHIESPQFSGKVQRLEAWFRDGSLAPDAAVAGPRGLLAANSSQPPQSNGNLNSELQNHGRGIVPSPGNAAAGGVAEGQSSAHYEIRRGNLLQAWIVTTPQAGPPIGQPASADGRANGNLSASGNSFQLEHLDIQGDVWIAQSHPDASGESPLEIIGDRVQVLRANTLATEMAVVGQPAQVGAHGTTMFGPAVQVDCAANRLWIDGAGRMTHVGTASQDPQSRVATPSGAVTVTGDQTPHDDLMSARGTTVVDWQGNMQFDGKTARFQRDVVAQQIEPQRTETIHTPVLEATLHDRIDFNALRQAGSQHITPPIELLACQGDVLLEGRETRDGKSAAFDQLQIHNLVVNHISGDLTGEGPGRLLSWSLGTAANATDQANGFPAPRSHHPSPGTAASGGVAPGGGLSGVGLAGKQVAPINGIMPVSTVGNPSSGELNQAGPEQIYFSDIQFQRGVTGNILSSQRHITFQDQVRAIRGPVPTWEARLDADSPTGLAPDTMFVTCDQLTVSEIGPRTASGGNHEMEAQGNIRLEDQQPQGDMYTAQAHRMTYSEAKNLIVLQGDGRIPAELDKQTGASGPRSPLQADTINYWRSTAGTPSHASWQGLKFGEGRFNSPPSQSKKQ